MPTLETTATFGIFYADNPDVPVFLYDSFVNFKVDHKMKVSDFVVEKGAFATYNKVQHPYEIKVTLAINEGPLRREVFVDELETIMKSLTRMNIVTPEKTFINVTMDHYTFERTPKAGWGKIVAELSFIEVREVNTQYQTAKIGAGKPKTPGKVLPVQNDVVNPKKSLSLADLKTSVANLWNWAKKSPNAQSATASSTKSTPQVASTTAGGTTPVKK